MISNNITIKLNIFKTDKPESFLDRLLKIYLFLTQIKIKIKNVN